MKLNRPVFRFVSTATRIRWMIDMRSILKTLAAVGAIAFVAGPAVAQDLAGDALKSFIGGKTINLRTPYGLELPLVYRSNGQVTGDVSGFTMARMFAPRETGKWWVQGERLCQQWPTCMTARRSASP